ncbi:DUF5610 domain-containing protein [Kosakonia sp. BK9b]
MSIKDVGAVSATQNMPDTTRQSKTIIFAGKEIVTERSIAVTFSAEALARGMEGHTPPTKEQIEETTRAVAATRNNNIAATTRGGPSLASAFYGDPATANDAVRFIDFFQHSTVAADDMANALHQAMTSPEVSGDYTTNAMDLALTQAKLNKVVQQYVSADYQQQASDFVAQFIREKADQADQQTRVVLTQAATLAQSLGDSGQAQHHQEAIAQLSAGTHASQTVRNEMLQLTAGSKDSDVWFTQLNDRVNASPSLPYISEMEKSHISALQQQWQSFVNNVSAVK